MTTADGKPVILVGMHRSGTSLICRKLEQLGLFVGSRKDRHNESLWFQSLNRWILGSCGATWDNPGPLLYLYRDSRLRALTVDYLRHHVSGLSSMGFLGLRKYLRYGSLGPVSEPWGWKDPVNTVTFPLWLELFPNSKILMIVRNPIDVASSLRKRSLAALEGAIPQHESRKLLGPLYRKKGCFTGSPRVLDIQEAIGLWQEYADIFESESRNLGIEQEIICYEDFLARPSEVLSDAANFCGLQVDRATINGLCQDIDASRANAYLHDPELANISKSHSEDSDESPAQQNAG